MYDKGAQEKYPVVVGVAILNNIHCFISQSLTYISKYSFDIVGIT